MFLAIPATLLLAAPAPPQEPFLTLSGPSPGSEFGASVAVVGDLDGDGTPDLLAGAPREAAGGSRAGATLVLSGADGSQIRRHDGAADQRLGFRVLGLPDLDGDGTADYAVSAQRDNPAGLLSGLVRLFSGATGSLIREFRSASTWDRFGECLAAPGDLDGDGVADLLIGAPNDDWQGPGAGAVYVFSGATGARLQVQFGTDPWDLFGTSACGVGDLDGDGRDDFAVGAPRADAGGTDAGAVRVVSGRTGAVLLRLDGQAGQVLGLALGGPADFDGDGLPDLAVGGVEELVSLTQRPGGVSVFRLTDGARIARFEPDDPDEGFGQAVALLGDGDGDGFGDLLAGAPFAGEIGGTGLAAGAARIFGGLTGRRSFEWTGDANQDRLGAALVAAGDLNGDGLDDFLVGEPGANPAGAVWVFHSRRRPGIAITGLVAGGVAEVVSSGGRPGDLAIFFFGRQGFGETTFATGISLDLASPVTEAGRAPVDAAGVARLLVAVPPGAAGLRIWLQAWHAGSAGGLPSLPITAAVG
ncbi:MAG: hypothetical protein D6702_03140 [Planctomycetota bacterium]|nr:MAG: hypothetical protein D6702_03140 [Planctomycetota bacterium]